MAKELIDTGASLDVNPSILSDKLIEERAKSTTLPPELAALRVPNLTQIRNRIQFVKRKSRITSSSGSVDEITAAFTPSQELVDILSQYGEGKFIEKVISYPPSRLLLILSSQPCITFMKEKSNDPCILMCDTTFGLAHDLKLTTVLKRKLIHSSSTIEVIWLPIASALHITMDSNVYY